MGTVFTGQQVRDFAHYFGIEINYSTPYNAQANGQDEALNKILKDKLRKTIQEKPKSGHTLLPQILRAYNTSCRPSTRTNPYTLTYGHDAVLLMEVEVPSIRWAYRHKLGHGN